MLNVMIASPGDVTTEREIVTEELLRWNAANGLARRLLLQPVKWETHSSPQMGSHPQSIINERLLTDADIVVGIFGIRIGSATREYISGSVALFFEGTNRSDNYRSRPMDSFASI